jgi:hypothetical protein
MNDITFTKYIKIDENDCITAALTTPFVKDVENWIEAGTHNQYSWHLNIMNEYGTYLYCWDGSEIQERDPQDIDADNIVNAKVLKKSLIKNDANGVILNMYPYWKQNNIQTRAIDLVNIKLDRVLTTEEQAEYDAIQAIKDWIYSIRTQSNDMELEVDGLTTLNDIESYSIDYIV